MSYCRFSPESDVYMYPNVNGKIVCSACRIAEGHLGDLKFDTEEEAMEHLKAHIKAGHSVPMYAMNRLVEEAKARKEDLS